MSKKRTGSQPRRTNLERANRALNVATEYLDDVKDVKTAVIDLLADVHHLCDKQGLDFSSMLKSARNHHAAEVAGDFV